MTKKINTIVDPKALLCLGVNASAKEMAEVFLTAGLAESVEQAQYIAKVQEMGLGFMQYHAAMAIGRLAGGGLDPVDTNSADFRNLYNQLANETLARMPAQGRA